MERAGARDVRKSWGPVGVVGVAALRSGHRHGRRVRAGLACVVALVAAACGESPMAEWDGRTPYLRGSIQLGAEAVEITGSRAPGAYVSPPES